MSVGMELAIWLGVTALVLLVLLVLGSIVARLVGPSTRPRRQRHQAASLPASPARAALTGGRRC